ncbi:hypothetical protein EYB45_01830 [Erythrobacteraceae bacterium CFH 75059]|uniref:hypothetical protein n=1 Tax=Qipengyuania thermophila TaxID=2509361 RepID=UPI00101EEC51|nr:hypothetical protein [Qipengyuania thermophila]TCD06485.1 hypothetical protein EYB45_01830 [Erythrobacteraceae bacterium CFH 75059]
MTRSDPDTRTTPATQKQHAGGQSQTLGTMTQSQGFTSPEAGTARGEAATGPSGHDIPQEQAGYGSSHGTQAASGGGDAQAPEDKTASAWLEDDADDAEAALGGKAVPGEISSRPDEQARADANPQLYEG